MEPWLERFARANFRRSADTAHDLKTPLNVAVLNLELLRMRMRKLTGDDDPKLLEYTRAIETELRRMGAIFDAFFLLSTPPPGVDGPSRVELAPLVRQEAETYAFPLPVVFPPASIEAHEPRIRQACRLFFEGASRLLLEGSRSVTVLLDGDQYTVSVSGLPAGEFELPRVFKFYYSDADGAPDLSLAVARLIAETYGGEIRVAEERVEERDNVVLRLTFPLGEK